MNDIYSGEIQECLRTFWRWLRDGESSSTTIRNLGLVIAATIALPLAIWRSMVAARQADAARKQSETAQRGLLNERYQKGAEMLGSNVLVVRLDGIYALVRLSPRAPRRLLHADYESPRCVRAAAPASGNQTART